MERFYQVIGRHFSGGEIEGLASELSLEVLKNDDLGLMAQGLVEAARRNLRLDALFNEVHRAKAALRLNFRPFLYELIAGTFTEQEVAALTRRLGLQYLNPELNAAGLAGWSGSDYQFNLQKARILQETAEQHNIYEALLSEMAAVRPTLDLSIFQQPTADNLKGGRYSTAAEQKGMGDIIYGDKVGGDKIEGDKVGGDKINGDKHVYKGIKISGVSGGSAVAVGGDAVVGTQVKEVQGNVTIGGEDKRPDRDALLILLAQLQQDVAAVRTELDERDAQEAAETLQAVAEEVQKEKPAPGWVVRKLKNVGEIAAAAGAATAAAGQLGTHIQQAVQMVQSLFGG